MDTITLCITLPLRGTAHDYSAAVTNAIVAHTGNGLAQMALGQLLATMQVPRPMVPTEGRSQLVYGRGQ